MRHTIVYHDRCTDGLTAAAVAYHKFGNTVDYVPYTLEKGFPELKVRHNSVVTFLDCAPPIKNYLDLVFDQKAQIIILDHHVSNMKLYQDNEIEDENYHFDMSKSGAGMAWDFYFSKEERPLFINLVEDRDLWKYRYGQNSVYLYRALDLVPNSITEYQKYLMYPNKVEELIQMGVAIEEYVQTKVLRVCNAAPQKRMIEGFWCVLANACDNISDVGNKLLDLHPDCQVAIAYTHNPQTNMFKFSLRSRQSDNNDCTDIARKYGGGGHKNASGCQLTAEQFMEILK